MDIGAQVVGPCFHLCKQTGNLRVKTPGFPLAKILHISKKKKKNANFLCQQYFAPPLFFSLNMLVVGELRLCDL